MGLSLGWRDLRRFAPRTWQSANSRASTAQSRSRRLRNFKRGRQPLMRADLGLNSVCDLLNAVLSSLAQSPLRESLGKL